MKKAIISICALVLLGAGCMGQQTVEGDWYLAFDMPSGWIMIGDYDVDMPMSDVEEISLNSSDIVLQSTGANVWVGKSREPFEEELAEIGEIVTEDFTYIRVFRLDDRRVIPSEAEDLGNGFYKLDLCIDMDCIDGLSASHEYYLEVDDNKYKFMVYQIGQDLDIAEEVILSAKEVTITE